MIYFILSECISDLWSQLKILQISKHHCDQQYDEWCIFRLVCPGAMLLWAFVYTSILFLWWYCNGSSITSPTPTLNEGECQPGTFCSEGSHQPTHALQSCIIRCKGYCLPQQTAPLANTALYWLIHRPLQTALRVTSAPSVISVLIDLPLPFSATRATT